MQQRRTWSGTEAALPVVAGDGCDGDAVALDLVRDGGDDASWCWGRRRWWMRRRRMWTGTEAVATVVAGDEGGSGRCNARLG